MWLYYINEMFGIRYYSNRETKKTGKRKKPGSEKNREAKNSNRSEEIQGVP